MAFPFASALVAFRPNITQTTTCKNYVNLIKNNTAKILCNMFIETFRLISLNHCQCYSYQIKFYLNKFYLNKIDNGLKKSNQNVSINMFYSILAVLFLIKLFKKSVYHAPLIIQSNMPHCQGFLSLSLKDWELMFKLLRHSNRIISSVARGGGGASAPPLA